MHTNAEHALYLNTRLRFVSPRPEGHHSLPHLLPAVHPGISGTAGTSVTLCPTLLLQVCTSLSESCLIINKIG